MSGDKQHTCHCNHANNTETNNPEKSRMSKKQQSNVESAPSSPETGNGSTSANQQQQHQSHQEWGSAGWVWPAFGVRKRTGSFIENLLSREMSQEEKAADKVLQTYPSFDPVFMKV